MTATARQVEATRDAIVDNRLQRHLLGPRLTGKNWHVYLRGL